MRLEVTKVIVITIVMLSFLGFSPIFIEDETPDLRVQMAGMTSWYSSSDPGVLPTTANMEFFDDTGFTCAMWGVPFNTWVEVTNQENMRSVIVRVNDRGPAFRFVRENRIIDLSKAAFAKLADTKKGLINVKVEIVYTEV